MATPVLSPVRTSDLKSKILRPALTSTYSVHIIPPEQKQGDKSEGNLKKYLEQNGIYSDSGLSVDAALLQLTCSEASLPGSTLATIDVNNDYMGITQRHAYRRLYDDRVDFTFYVTQNDNYYQIRFFDAWMRYITGEQYAKDVEKNFFISRVLYPKQYQGEIRIAKFEKDYGSPNSLSTPLLEYRFLQAYPVSINSIPVSYDTSSLLKVTVSFVYTRYYIEKMKKNIDTSSTAANSSAPGQPELKGTVTNEGQEIINAITLNNKSLKEDVASLQNMQQASMLRQAGYSPGLGQSGAMGPGF